MTLRFKPLQYKYSCSIRKPKESNARSSKLKYLLWPKTNKILLPAKKHLRHNFQKNLRNNETKKFVSYKKNVLQLYGCFSCDAPARKMNQMYPYVYSPFTQLQRENEHLLPNYYKTVKTFCSHILIAGDYNRRFINCHFVTLHK